ncbi:MAG: type II toxin-antitoxin system Phd/YefM family antitoxin [Gammaproteobacteria bacterium]|nr:type II toxin-antitoxin system Phd/YefM family antitoxin [Gammaproteobacteria bacterium]
MITATQFRNNVYGILDEVLSTGIHVDIERHGKHLRIVALDKPHKLKNLKPIKNLIVGDPVDLENIES